MNLKRFLGRRGELKQVIVVRKDLGMSKGKAAAQVAHAAISAAEKSEWRSKWIAGGQKKSVLVCRDEAELVEIFMKAKDANLPAELIQDAGRTELSSGTKTCVGIGPAQESDIDKITGDLKLL